MLDDAKEREIKKLKIFEFDSNKNLNDPSTYLPSDELHDAVQVALLLGQPLLVTGEPGTGKTQLAYYIAHELGLDKPLIFNSQTDSNSTDLFYSYDALGHFHYSQNAQNEILKKSEIEEKFINYQALGEAIRNEKKKLY